MIYLLQLYKLRRWCQTEIQREQIQTYWRHWELSLFLPCFTLSSPECCIANQLADYFTKPDQAAPYQSLCFPLVGNPQFSLVVG